MELYAYGMTERGYSPMAQPNGVKDWQPFDKKCELPSGKRVWSIIWYDAPLSEKDVKDYELVRLPEEDR